MEPQELSPALLQPQVTVVAILGELLATLPGRDEEMILLVCPLRLYWDLEDFTKELRATLCCINGTWWHRNVTSDAGDSPTSLSRAMAAYESTPWTTWYHVAMAASKWQRSVDVLVDRRARLASKATKLCNTCREVATEATEMVAITTARARELQDEAAQYGTAQENIGELDQALGRQEGAEVVSGYEAWVRREATVAASWARRATMERQQLEVALGLLERLVAACDEATAFPRELQHLLRDIKAALDRTNQWLPGIPEDWVAKVAVAERLWEANAHLVKDHLLGTFSSIIKFFITGGPASPSACWVAEQCQRAIEDIPRLVSSLVCPQGVPKVSPVSMEPQELSLSLLQPQVTVVAILGELLATLPRWDEGMMLLGFPSCLYGDVEDFTKELRDILYCTDDTWRRSNVTCDDDEVCPISLSQALAAWESTPWTTWDNVTMAASKCQESVAALVDSWARLARAATELGNTCREVATEAANRAATARARELQDEAARDGTVQENMVELGQGLSREEGAEVAAGHEAQVRSNASVAASEARMATMVRQRMEEALGLLERLVATCYEATVFPWELQRRVGDIKAALKGTNEASPNVPEDLVAKVSVAEQLWEANTCLVKDHLLGIVDDIIKLYFDGGPSSPSARGVAEQCQRATEDIPRLLRPPQRSQAVPGPAAATGHRGGHLGQAAWHPAEAG